MNILFIILFSTRVQFYNSGTFSYDERFTCILTFTTTLIVKRTNTKQCKTVLIL